MKYIKKENIPGARDVSRLEPPLLLLLLVGLFVAVVDLRRLSWACAGLCWLSWALTVVRSTSLLLLLLSYGVEVFGHSVT
jgi:hypothetical protein